MWRESNKQHFSSNGDDTYSYIIINTAWEEEHIWERKKEKARTQKTMQTIKTAAEQRNLVQEVFPKWGHLKLFQSFS